MKDQGLHEVFERRKCLPTLELDKSLKIFFVVVFESCRKLILFYLLNPRC